MSSIATIFIDKMISEANSVYKMINAIHFYIKLILCFILIYFYKSVSCC